MPGSRPDVHGAQETLTAEPEPPALRWERWAEWTVPPAEEPAIEWWTVLVLRPRGEERLHFVERPTAEAYVRFLLDQGIPLVALERWRDSGRVAVELLAVPPEG
jgi:hypothetical protein